MVSLVMLTPEFVPGRISFVMLTDGFALGRVFLVMPASEFASGAVSFLRSETDETYFSCKTDLFPDSVSELFSKVISLFSSEGNIKSSEVSVKNSSCEASSVLSADKSIFTWSVASSSMSFTSSVGETFFTRFQTGLWVKSCFGDWLFVYCASSITRYALLRFCSKGSGVLFESRFFASASLAALNSCSVESRASGIISCLRNVFLTDSVKKLQNPMASLNRTSILVGCTFTSTLEASMVICRTHKGNLCCMRYCLYPSSRAFEMILLRINLPLIK